MPAERAPDGANPTQANPNANPNEGINDLIAAGILVGGAALGAALLFNSNGGGAPFLVPASP